jgi:hypothetical protein
MKNNSSATKAQSHKVKKAAVGKEREDEKIRPSDFLIF